MLDSNDNSPAKDLDDALNDLQIGEMRTERTFRLNLVVGTRMVMRFGLGDEKNAMDVPAELTGFSHYEFMIVRLQPAPGLLPRLNQGGKVSVRFLNEGAANLFQSEILGHINRPALLLTLSYPTIMNTVQVRKHKRVVCALPVLIEKEGLNALAMVRDLSKGGCKLILDVRGQSAARSLEVGDKLNLRVPLDLRKNLEIFKTTVRNVELEQYRLILGLAFESLPTDISERLDAFLAQSQLLLS